ncbi:DUF7537 family lipoprotein [Natranaeroarchaeum aerophilus]|uniref:Lipoprotein n=1 Tax=Natranaeroarchaeum aerophilus TaxID=2917711 RepID=A0AAE3K354_9EURY|nr:hypothetical protein [Natranaeroarchaeum aerophilus]MCL9812096.1 hypothetical protein [Natranaeroarchaeum aerophilus]
MHRRRVLLGMGSLVALAGCNGQSGDDGNGEEEDGDEKNGEEEIDPTYPAGFDEYGVTDADEALAGHEAAIADRPVHGQTTIELTIPTDDGEDRVQQLSLTTRADGAGTEYSRIDLTESTAETYRDGDGLVYTRIDDGENVQYEADEIETPEAVSLGTFGPALAAADLELEDVSDDDPRRLTYSGSGVLDENTTFGDVEDVETQIVVDEEGAFHSFSVSYTVPDGADVEASFEFTYDDVTVEEPDWLDEARE